MIDLPLSLGTIAYLYEASQQLNKSPHPFQISSLSDIRLNKRDE